MAVKITNPRTLSHAYKSARMHEAYLEAMRQPVQNSNQPRRYGDQNFQSKPPFLPTPSSYTNATTTRGTNRRTLSAEEMNEKRSKGLCYFCNEKYVFGHKCKNLKQLYLIEVEEHEEVESAQEKEAAQEDREIELTRPLEQMEISVHALNGSLGFRKLRVTGYHSKKPLHILVDTGSSHNFIDPKVVKGLGCQITSITPQAVTAANGNDMRVNQMCNISWLLQCVEFSAEFLLLPLGSCGVVLGVQWLSTLGDIKMNFKELTMEFWYKVRKHLLRGAGK